MKKIKRQIPLSDLEKTILSVPIILSIFLYSFLLLLIGQFVRQSFNSESLINIPEIFSKTQSTNINYSYINAILPITGEQLTWYKFKNEKYGYKFLYTSDMNLMKFDSKDCISECDTGKTNWDEVILDSLEIDAFYSDSYMDFDFDKGLEKTKYNSPDRILVDNTPFYLITSKKGDIAFLAKDFIYIEDLLWIKNESKVSNEKGNYYISFYNSEPYSYDVNYIKAVFESFDF